MEKLHMSRPLFEDYNTRKYFFFDLYLFPFIYLEIGIFLCHFHPLLYLSGL